MSKKILFNDKFGLTQAVLEGRKTMTRRVIPQKVIDAYYDYEDAYCSINFGGVTAASMTDFLCGYSRYYLGDVLAIAQTYKDIYNDAYHIGLYGRTAGWTNKMYVAAYRMPHHIKITNIRMEHLQNISNEDCMREGVYFDKEEGQSIGYPIAVPFYYTFRGAINRDGKQLHWSAPQHAFAALIDKVSGKGTWDSNPLVWVYEFELVD